MSDKITKTPLLLDSNALLVAQRISASIGEVVEPVPVHATAWTECAE